MEKIMQTLFTVAMFSALLFTSTQALGASKTFQGSLAIPQNVLEGGDTFSVSAQIYDSIGFDTGVSSSQSFTYDSGTTDYAYSVVITDNQFIEQTGGMGETIVLQFRCNSCQNQLVDSYFTNTGSVGFVGLAEGLSNFRDNPMSETISGLDFSALEGQPLTINLSLPAQLDGSYTGQSRLVVRVTNGFSGPGSDFGAFESWSSPFSENSSAMGSVLSLSARVPALPPGFSYEVGYLCSEDTNEEIFCEGYFNSQGGTTPSAFSAERVADISSDLNMDVLAAVEISGQLVRGPNIDQSAAVQNSLCIHELPSQSNLDCLFSLIISAGESSVDFSFRVPVTSSTEGFTLSYDCSFFMLGDGCPSGAAQTGFYSADGSVASILSVTEPISPLGEAGVEFLMLEPIFLTGNLQLPNGQQALEVTSAFIQIVDLQTGAFSQGQAQFEIGDSVASYSIGVQSLSGEYSIAYICSDCPGTLRTGNFDGSQFIATSGFLLDPILDLSVLENETLTLIEAQTITVNVVIPEGVPELSDFLFGEIEVFDNQTFTSYFGTFDFSPDSGERSKEVKVSVPPSSSDFSLRYLCFGCSGFTDIGYFDGVGSVFSRNGAVTVSNASAFDGANIPLLQSTELSFSIATPNGDPASQDLFGNLSLVSENGGLDVFNSFHIPIGSSSALVTFIVPENLPDLFLSYSCFSCDGVLDEGHFDGVAFSDLSARQLTPVDNLAGQTFNLLEPFEFSGVLALPNGETATADSFIEISAFNRSSGVFSSDQVFIPEGSSSAPFSMIAERFGEYEIRYSCSSCDGYLPQGRFDGTSFIRGFDVTPVTDLETLQGTTLEIIDAQLVNGVIERPSGDAATSDLFLRVFVEASDFSDVYSVDVFIASGQSSADFALTLPLASESDSYILSYSCFSGCDGLFGRGFYSSEGTQASFSTAEEITDVQQALNDPLILLGKIDVSGEVRLPEGISPEGVTRVLVQLDILDPQEGSAIVSDFAFVEITVGDTSVPYEASLPDIPGQQLRVSYLCDLCDELLVSSAFVGENGSVEDEASAFIFDTDALPTSVDIDLLEAVIISGVVSRPADSDNSQPITVQLVARESAGVIESKFVEIPGGEDQIEYSLSVARNRNISLTYICFDCESIWVSGHYNSSGTQVPMSNAETLIVENDSIDGINLEMVASTQISGELKRSILEQGTSEVAANILVDITNGSGEIENGFLFFGLGQQLLIGDGDLSTEFSIEVPEISDSFYQIRYRCPAGCGEGTFKQGFYVSNDLPATLAASQTGLLASASDNQDLVLEMLAGLTISGVVQAPESLNENISPSVLAVGVSPTEGALGDFNSFSKLNVAESGEYSITVPALEGAEYRVEYDCRLCDGILKNGYYSASATQFIAEKADLISGGSVLSDNNLTLLESEVVGGVISRSELDSQEEDLIGFLRLSVVDENGDPTGDILSPRDTLPRQSQSDGYSIEIPAQERTSVYSFEIPTSVATAGFLVDYFCDDCNELVDTVFYSNAGTTGKIEEATRVSLTSGTDFLSLSLSMLDDTDNDEIANAEDNCSALSNPNQANLDNDEFGDVCDDDIDGDQTLNVNDCAITDPELFQILNGFVDVDLDTIGAGEETTVCSGEALPVGFVTSPVVDNCPLIANSNQANFDQDLFGDVCDPDIDNDGAPDAFDTDSFNPLVCSDDDSDQCDDCSSGTFNLLDDGLDTDSDGMCDIGDVDDDADLVNDDVDNCPIIPNPDQADSDRDGIGNLCEVNDEVCFPVVLETNGVAVICF